MHVEELKGLASQIPMFSESGPIGISFHAIVAAIESQELRIAELESRLGATHLGTFPVGLETKGMHDQAVALQGAKETEAAKLRDKLKA